MIEYIRIATIRIHHVSNSDFSMLLVFPSLLRVLAKESATFFATFAFFFHVTSRGYTAKHSSLYITTYRPRNRPDSFFFASTLSFFLPPLVTSRRRRRNSKTNSTGREGRKRRRRKGRRKKGREREREGEIHPERTAPHPCPHCIPETGGYYEHEMFCFLSPFSTFQRSSLTVRSSFLFSVAEDGY